MGKGKSEKADGVSTQLFKISLRKNIPLDIIVELTNQCNLNCIHCYVSGKNKVDNRELSAIQWKNIFDQLADIGCLYLTFTGGEIFARKDIFELMEYARNKGFALTLFTNGTLLNDEIIKRIKKLNVMEIHLTLYSMSPEIHDKITRKRGSYLKTKKTIKKLCENGLNVVVKCPLMKLNFFGYQRVLNFANYLGARAQFDPVITPKNDGCRTPLRYRINQRQLTAFYRDKTVFPEDKINTATVCSPLSALRYSCSAGRNLASITAEGLVYPCLQFPVVLGDLNSNSFKKIWLSENNKPIKKIRNLKLPGICQKCSNIVQCNRCPGLTLLEEGSMVLPSKIACRIAKIRNDK